MTNVHEAQAVRRELTEWCKHSPGALASGAGKVILGLDAYILNKGNVTPGFLAGLAADVKALAVHAHPQ